eukprot:1161172-Pelagomonas_calceolata.AAC.10
MDNPLQRWILNVLRNLFGVKTTTPSWSVLRKHGIEPFQFNWFRATMRFYNLLAKCNSLLLKKVLHADSLRLAALAPELTLVGHHTSCLHWMVWHTQT